MSKRRRFTDLRKSSSPHISGLYDEMKAIFLASTDRIEKTDH
jgi:hypothetical protein